jgi:hypothetical protein
MSEDRRRFTFLASPLILAMIYAICVTGFSATKLQMLLRLSDFFARPILTIWLALGTVMLVTDLVRESKRPNPRDFKIYLRDMGRLARSPVNQIICITPPLVFTLLMAAYSLFKQVVIPASGYWAGPGIMSLEYHLLLGHHAWQITHALLPVDATYWLDQVYQAWFVLMVGSMIACSHLSGDPLHRCRFMLCFMASWIIGGTALAYLIPASGPIYLSHFHPMPDPFIALKARLAADDHVIRAVHGTGLFALQGQSLLLEKLKAGLIFPGGGISAMPSMHNAIAVLLACAGSGISRWLGRFLSIFAMLIFVGSIHLGWHYALDGIVAGAISIGLWSSSGALLARYERRISGRRLRAAGGRRRTDRRQTTAA